MSDIRDFETHIQGNVTTIYDYRDVIAPQGDFKKVKGINTLIYSLRNLLLTPLGSYPWDPEYGSILYKLVWELKSDETRDQIEYEVYDRVREFDDRIDIESVIIEYFRELKGYRVSLSIKKGNELATTEIDISQDHGIGLE